MFSKLINTLKSNSFLSKVFDVIKNNILYILGGLTLLFLILFFIFPNTVIGVLLIILAIPTALIIIERNSK